MAAYGPPRAGDDLIIYFRFHGLPDDDYRVLMATEVGWLRLPRTIRAARRVRRPRLARASASALSGLPSMAFDRPRKPPLGKRATAFLASKAWHTLLAARCADAPVAVRRTLAGRKTMMILTGSGGESRRLFSEAC